MSNKSAQPKKKLSVPRELVEIEKEFNQRCFQAGQLQYQVNILTKELSRVNSRLEEVSNEGAARKQLDAVAAAAKPEEVQGATSEP